jgi:CRISPR/Cas system-associated exonuclease Cas4 (RecB family)
VKTDKRYWREAAKTQPVWLCEVSLTPVTYQRCLGCAQQRLEPACPFPPQLLAALHAANQPDDVVEGIRHTGYPVIRVSSLLGCKYRSWLGRNEGYPLETPTDHWARLRGSLIHRAIEEMGADAGGLTEKRLTAFVWQDQLAAFVTGRVDAYDIHSRTLFDFKTVNLGRHGLDAMQLPRPRHVKQLTLYAWLLALNGYPPPQQFRLIYMTMAELRAVEVKSPDEAALAQIEGWVLSILQDILADQPPPPKPVEGWECQYCPFSQCISNRRAKAKQPLAGVS